MLRARVAGEEFGQGGGAGFAFVKDGIHLVDDGGPQVIPAGGGVDGFGVGHAFRDHVHGVGDVLQGLSFAKQAADAIVAAVAAVAGDDEVADAAEALKSLEPTAGGHAEACHFGKSAGDERGAGIVAESESLTDAAGDGEDVFHGSAPLDSRDVRAAVSAEPGQREKVLQAAADGLVMRADDGGGGEFFGDFLSVVRAGKNSQGLV
ncbi:MAG: hypothetical protein JWL81_2343, partial [Verrucomicrobiales bacterium]|nr:hypothetical protein [Verrucomicrobiales bacterium]